jgi:hypothetical protein
MTGRAARLLPGLAQLRGYRRSWLRGDAVTALMTAAVVAPMAGGNPARYAVLAAALAVVVGCCASSRTPRGWGSWRTCCPGRFSSGTSRASGSR